MAWLVDLLAVYRRVATRAAQLVARSWVLVVAAVAYTYLLMLVATLTTPLGLVGGLLRTLAAAACGSSWLTLLGRAIRDGRADLGDLPGSFVAYLGDVLAVSFLLWLLSTIAGLAFATSPFLQIVFALAVITFFNAVPELIYLGHHGAAELLVASYRFVGESWIEWFPPTILLGLVLAGTARLVPAGPAGLFEAAAVGAVLAYASLVRGLLFLELTRSGRRARAFRRRAGG